MTFALDLSKRLVDHEHFSTILKRLETCATATSIRTEPVDGIGEMEYEDMAMLHYCAKVFVQTDDTTFRRLAQSIALNTLLLRGRGEFVDKSIALLTDLGNFPAVDYARRMFSDLDAPNLLDGIGRALSRVINSIKVGVDRIALTDFQKEAWDSLQSEATVAISAPTAAGKSFLVIEYLCRLAERHSKFRAVYIAPTRALLAEVHDKISRRLAERGDVHISTVPVIDPSPSSKHIYVLTQERLQFLLALDTGAFDLVVVDEAQNLSDGPRGMILQECLEQVINRDSLTRLILLAPGAGGFQHLAESLGKKNFHEQRSVLPTVLQNRIVVRKAANPNSLDLHLFDKGGPTPLGIRRSERRFDNPATRLAAIALELGSSGGSLVYATGADKSETLASKLASERSLVDDSSVDELALFIRDHVHKEYGLADHVRRGVAFHYGKMPTLLRETIEAAFKNDVIKFLVCTTTLFQGVNLPARNVFINTPKRGSGALLDAAQLWNFVGRAGRMKEDIVGNVFLVDYDDWEVKPLDEFVGFKISPAFEHVVNERHEEVVRAVLGDMPKIRRRDEIAPRVRAAAGLLISKAALGTVSEFVERTLSEISVEQKTALKEAALFAKDELGLPEELLMTNWTVNPYGLKRLYDYFLERIEMGRVDELIPLKPHEDGALNVYKEIFKTVQREINETSVAAGSYHAVVGGMAVRWMKGVPYPKIISLQIKRARQAQAKRLAKSLLSGTVTAAQQARLREPVDVDAIVRRTFDMIEDEVRFQYVQLGKAYVDLLRVALIENNLTRLTNKIFNFPVALELGVATKAGWSFMELGLSRISAAALEGHFNEANATAKSAREWLARTRLAELRLSPIIVNEITRLGLADTSVSVVET